MVQEARKLEQIQQELARIDGSLNTDVRFLRDSIEQASLGKKRLQLNIYIYIYCIFWDSI
jgi:hypothetical protein